MAADDAVRTKHERRAVFLDRDGTLNANPPSGDFVRRPEDLRLLPEAIPALKSLSAAGYVIVVFSNQSGIAKGLMTKHDVDAVNARLREMLAAGGVQLAGIYICPHGNDDDCDCRKPKPGLLHRATRELGLDLGNSWAVGDSARDIEAGHTAGCRTILVHGNSYPGQKEEAEALSPVASVPDLAGAADVIRDAHA
jgi:D-glycero-D-manno-heptose 1,7-bisphosphate phosphatase